VTVRIGITGPIGCGKSTVAGWLAEEPGVVVIDADQVAREIVEPGEPAFDDIVERFGMDILTEEGEIDRSRLGRIVFGDPSALRDLEAITGPPARARILGAIEAAELEGASGVVVEAIRLIDGGLAAVCDEVWLVTCDPTAQMDRVLGRGSDPEDARRRIEAQAGLSERVRPVATRVIDTSGTMPSTRARIAEAFQAALAART
jgi:dephospho-CoA kinase